MRAPGLDRQIAHQGHDQRFDFGDCGVVDQAPPVPGHDSLGSGSMIAEGESSHVSHLLDDFRSLPDKRQHVSFVVEVLFPCGLDGGLLAIVDGEEPAPAFFQLFGDGGAMCFFARS
ncbi:MAG: hypothetical protein ACRYG8_01075 [Janthinobacterium lividum]